MKRAAIGNLFMFNVKVRNVVLLFFLVYILTAFINAGFMGTDEYWTGITRYVPAQEKTLHNMMVSDDVKSPTQIMPLLGLSHLAWHAGLNAPYEQYRFVQIIVGLFSTLMIGFCLLYFIPSDRHLFTFLTFTFYFAGAFAFTRPMYESMSAPWILLSALSLKKYFSDQRIKWVLLSTLAISISFMLRPQTGVCAVGLVGFLLFRRDWKAFFAASALGLFCFILAGLPDIYLREGFHSSLKGILFYNVQHGASYAQQPWFFYIPLLFVILWGPFWLSRKTGPMLKAQWPEHQVYWVYIFLLVGLHSLFPQKWERFLIPVMGLLILILADWIEYFWRQSSHKRIFSLIVVNAIVWIPATLFPAQKNIMDMSRYLDVHPEILQVFRLHKNPQWITEVFIRRKDWKWVEVDEIPTQPLTCDARLVMNIHDFEKFQVGEAPLNERFAVEKVFETNLIEKVAYRFNPEKNVRRTPLVLLQEIQCENR
jgi:hypothetical protein